MLRRFVRPMLFAFVAAVLALAGTGAAIAASENYCPGSPWNCVKDRDCYSITWCGDTGSLCNFSEPHHQYKKYFIIKRCTNGEEVQYCSSCGPAEYVECCGITQSEPTCPNLRNCYGMY